MYLAGNKFALTCINSGMMVGPLLSDLQGSSVTVSDTAIWRILVIGGRRTYLRAVGNLGSPNRVPGGDDTARKQRQNDQFGV